ncbi:hypothetical protein PTTG_31045 [Puccinia triticina 1-1 BBBD Race 1]|uniref:NAM-associated domain-containing protein n=1 Tax=Puccinia triticina (isolate 1-1 / race 1 (BBBD)) TaxID=630390 RepID=A0A180FWE6_PUCT1|nr:hypothetical protein PTTG_31045 [Puccinia triticina 1-1 BBBD Race 1]
MVAQEREPLASPVKSKEWKRPIGIKNAKRLEAEELYKRKKMKMLELAHNDAVKRLAEAKRGNDIQSKLVEIDRRKTNLNCMLQNIEDCPDEVSREYLISEKKNDNGGEATGHSCINNSTSRTKRSWILGNTFKASVARFQRVSTTLQ